MPEIIFSRFPFSFIFSLGNRKWLQNLIDITYIFSSLKLWNEAEGKTIRHGSDNHTRPQPRLFRPFRVKTNKGPFRKFYDRCKDGISKNNKRKNSRYINLQPLKIIVMLNFNASIFADFQTTTVTVFYWATKFNIYAANI